MKNWLLLLATILSQTLMAQNVGIGTSTPDASALLHIDLGTSTTKGILVNGIGNPSSTVPNLGAGSRMMFYPGKAAFRAGAVDGTEWNDANVGKYSFATGLSTIASGTYSNSMGHLSTATGYYSAAMGYATTAGGNASTAMGYLTTASGHNSTSMGTQTTASGLNSTAMGQGTTASGFYSTAMGFASAATGYYSAAMGYFTSAKSGFETVLGSYNTDYTPLNTVSGDPADRLFSIGNGTSSSSKSDALVILKNGNTGIGTSLPNAGALLHIDLDTSTTKGVLVTGTYDLVSTVPNIGAGSRMMFYPGKAAFRAGAVDGTEWDDANVGFGSFATGLNTTASGIFSNSMGYGSTATGYYSAAMGYGSAATGNNSTAMGQGSTASGNISTAMGQASAASGSYSTAMGSNTYAKSSYETVLGRWNTDYTPSSIFTWVASDRLFTIGNGTDFSSRSDALVVLKNGNTGIGNSTPAFPLSFATAFGDKISLWSNSANSYGFGIQSGLLQIHTDVAASDIAFGYGSSNSFTQRMRIINNGGYDGMSLNGRLILKNGSTDPVGGGAGVWLYKADNTAVLGFMGTQNNQNIGFFGGPVGWGFTYDAINSRVGIGTTNPGAALDIKSTVSSDNLRIGDNGSASTYFKIGRNTVTGNLDFTAIQGTYGYTFMSGNFGIGTTTPANLLEVNGTAAKPGGGAWTAISDARLKQDISSYSDGLAAVMAIKPVRYHYNNLSGLDTKPEYIGVVAQQLKEVAPYMVGHFKKDGTDYLDVNNSAMTYMLINGMQEQQKMIEQQSKEIEVLKLLVKQLLKNK